MTPLTVTRENFQKEVLESDKPVLLDFWADWCGHCVSIAPIIDEIARERTDIKVGKINVDEQMELAEEFEIMSIPMLAVMRNGKIVSRRAGAQSKGDILKML